MGTISWKTFGHERVKSVLGRQLFTGKFPHAYLFSGPDGIGKKTLALEFAGKILGASQVSDLRRHPDFQILDEPGQIAAERMREFIGSLGHKPFLAGYKVAVIDNAQNMNPQSGNALLKTLEEPSPSTILILVSSGRQLLPTIVSRCQAFGFNAFTTEQILEFARLDNLDINDQLAALAFGSIARLRKLSGDSAFRQDSQQHISRFENLQREKPAERLLAVAEFAELETEQLEEVFAGWYYWQAGQLKNEPAKYGVLAALDNALRQLKTNKNKKMVLQGLFLKI